MLLEPVVSAANYASSSFSLSLPYITNREGEKRVVWAVTGYRRVGVGNPQREVLVLAFLDVVWVLGRVFVLAIHNVKPRLRVGKIDGGLWQMLVLQR
ncbi:hypothetical protein Pmani_034849 [Petrolisthes manimaculis]|uniref:Uncharacterized protein n=1 Tax=Petrolisthes manimaculis TaxID=1843537 RepID=A0AAE1TP97_9EUCA|nr:hypothetical protein Pmani_034849 [Petrolisthes manimaculis]